MKGVVLAGGLGSRLLPMTRVTNKHLLPVYDRPMIYYPIQQLVHAGVRDILVVTGGDHAGDFLKLLRNGQEFGLAHLRYAYQEGEGGIAEALGLAEHFAAGEPIVVILGDNIFQDALVNHSDTDRRRIAVQCGVAYDTDLDRAKEVALSALEGIGCGEKEPEVFFESFGGSSIDFVARVWIDFQSQLDVKRTTDEMVREIKAAFDEADIEIPFPIRTLELGQSAEHLFDQQMSEAA